MAVRPAPNRPEAVHAGCNAPSIPLLTPLRDAESATVVPEPSFM